MIPIGAAKIHFRKGLRAKLNHLSRINHMNYVIENVCSAEIDSRYSLILSVFVAIFAMLLNSTFELCVIANFYQVWPI